MMSIEGDLQSRQIKHTPIDSVNELIIWKMNLLVVAANQNQIQICIIICIMSSEIINLSVFNQIEKCSCG